MTGRGPLAGFRVVEFAGLGPAPFAAMMLADHGAEVVRIARRASPGAPEGIDLLARGRRHLGLDLKQATAVDVARRLIARSHALVEGFRPGVLERLGLGPLDCEALNPALVYGRATGWGQDGPLAQAAGHDINYLSLSGVQQAIGRDGQTPTPVPGFIGDFGGGGMLLAFGILAALLDAQRTGRGQVIDAAVVDGAALLSTLNHGWLASGQWNTRAGTNMGDGGAPFYNTYRCADGQFVSIGAIEPAFYRELLQRTGLQEDPAFAQQWDRAAWPALRERMAAVMATRTRDEWCSLLEGSDACFAPVLDFFEAPQHPHLASRRTFGTAGGIVQPNPAPRFSRSPSAEAAELHAEGAHSEAVLRELDFSAREIADLRAQGAVWTSG